MEDQVKRVIVQLGEVSLKRGVSIGAVEVALALAQGAEKDSEPASFTNHILSEMLVDPSMTPAEVASLPDHVSSALIAVAADSLGIHKEYNSTSPNSPARERFYRAFQQWFSSTVDAAVAGIAERTRAMLLSAFAPLQFSISVPRVDYGPLVTPLAELLQASTDTLSVQMEVLHGINQRFIQLGKAFRQMLDTAELDAQATAPLLTQANLWIPPSAPLSLLRALRQVIEEGQATPETIENLFIEYFRQGGCTALRAMVLSWGRNPHFCARMSIILDALQAHIDGKFTLSVPALLPHVEGVTSSILGKSVNHRTGNHIRGLLEQGFPGFLHSASRDILIEFVTNIVYTGTDFNNFAADLLSKGLDETDFLNRHAILHGVHVNYANEGLSLRAFLLLDALSAI